MPTKGTPFKVKQAMRRREANWNLGIVAVDKKGSTQSAVFNDETSFASSQSTYDPLGAARNAAAPKFKSSTVGRLREGANALVFLVLARDEGPPEQEEVAVVTLARAEVILAQ